MNQPCFFKHVFGREAEVESLACEVHANEEMVQWYTKEKMMSEVQ
jgi:hypothetical protein